MYTLILAKFIGGFSGYRQLDTLHSRRIVRTKLLKQCEYGRPSNDISHVGLHHLGVFREQLR